MLMSAQEIRGAVLHGIGQAPRYETFPAPVAGDGGTCCSDFEDVLLGFRGRAARISGTCCSAAAHEVTGHTVLVVLM
jgi:hypothetical protein